MRAFDVFRGVEILGVTGSLEGEVTAIAYDSRQCVPGSLFAAVRGLTTDGRLFVSQALDHGARFVLYEGEPLLLPKGVTGVCVRDSRRALGAVGRQFYGHPSSAMAMAGIVGTKGKTTVTYLLESIFRAAGVSPGVLGTVNYRYGGLVLPAPNTTPESLDLQRLLAAMRDDGVGAVAAEVSSHAIDLNRVDECDFDVGVFTNFHQDHLDYHGTMERYYEAKRRFFTEVLPRSRKDRPVRMVVNGDDPTGRRLLRETTLTRWSYGIEADNDIRPVEVALSVTGITARVQTGTAILSLASPLVGRFNLYNILAAAAAALALEMPVEAIARGIAALENVPGRMERVSVDDEPEVFVDYAHTEEALRNVLETLSQFKTGRLITVFGCGGDRDRGKRPLMGRAAAEFSDRVILTSDNPRTEDPQTILREIEAGLAGSALRRLDREVTPDTDGYVVIPGRAEAIASAVASARRGDIVLIAGKGHEDYQILGTKKIAFDDRVEARKALRRTRENARMTA